MKVVESNSSWLHRNSTDNGAAPDPESSTIYPFVLYLPCLYCPYKVTPQENFYHCTSH